MAKPSFDLIPSLSIHPTYISTYKQIQWCPYRPGRPRDASGSVIKKGRADHLLTADKKTHGKVSEQARRKMSKATEYLLYLADQNSATSNYSGKTFNFKIAFVTLTLPSKQVHTDNEIKERCLNQMLIELKVRYKVRFYLWRAEKQKNNNIHFHILVDKFIPWSELRDRWNRIVNKLGYVERYRDEMKLFHREGFRVRENLLKHWDYQKQVKAYQKGKINDWSSPNSTDIHSIRKINNVKAYVLKYCTKDEENHEVEGRLWGSSEELSNIKGGQSVIDSQVSDELDKLISNYSIRPYKGDHFSVLHIPVQCLFSPEFPVLQKIFFEFVFERFRINPATHI